MKKIGILALFALILLPAFSQDAATLTGILAKNRASVMDFSYLVASELGMDVSPFEAYTYCDRFGTFRFNRTADEPITVKAASQFFMINYGLKGGLMWSAFHSPRYAWKELNASGFWKKGLDPDTVLSGRDVVVAASRFFSMYPEAKLRNPPSTEASQNLKAALLSYEEDKK